MSTNRLLVTIVCLLALAAASPASTPEEERLEAWKVDHEIGQLLLSGEKDLFDWARQVASSEVKDPRAALVKLNVCLRAALDDEACAAVRELWRHGADRVDNTLARGCYGWASNRYRSWDVARTVVETLAPKISRLDLGRGFFSHFRSEDHPRRWTDEALIAWLDARVASVPRPERDPGVHVGLPSVTFRYADPVDYWRHVRLQQLVGMGRGEAERKRLEAAVRARPTEAAATIEYLAAVKELREHRTPVESAWIDWMPGVCRPARTTDLRRIAARLVSLKQYGTAVKFYDRAIATPLTDEEATALRMWRQQPVSDQTIRLVFQVQLREKLAECLLKTGDTDRSQKLMVEAAELRKKHDLPPNAHLAGRVQAASGDRTIEERIREREEVGEDDPEYWRQRAEYFRGRGEVDEEEMALRRGLALSPAAPKPGFKSPTGVRERILSSLGRLLIRMKRPAEAAALLLAELKAAPIGSASSERAARMLAYDLPRHLDAEEPILWNWLERRTKWDHPEERLVWRMLEAAPSKSRAGYYARAEALTKEDGADASRAATLGWVLSRMDEALRAVPLLKRATATATEEPVKRKADFTLFEVYLDLENWRAAESLFPVAEKQLTPSEDLEWLGRIARIAAEKGAKKDAMRIFARVANAGLRCPDLVADLSRAGLREELRGWYAEARRRLPTARLRGIAD